MLLYVGICVYLSFCSLSVLYYFKLIECGLIVGLICVIEIREGIYNFK